MRPETEDTDTDIKEFHTVWNKETINKILREFRASRERFLCVGSPTFESLYKIYYPEFHQLVAAWNPDLVRYDQSSDSPLLTSSLRHYRIDFLNYCLTLLP